MEIIKTRLNETPRCLQREVSFKFFLRDLFLLGHTQYHSHTLPLGTATLPIPQDTKYIRHIQVDMTLVLICNK
jgi:hypothetical protein